MSLPNPADLIRQMAVDLRAHLARRAINEPRYIGIRTGGVWVAQALQEAMVDTSPMGTLDVSFYRDDFSQNGLHPQVRPSELPFEVEGQHLVLVDDVLMSGRTVRAALNELFDYGRPASVTLVCLLDLDAGELLRIREGPPLKCCIVASPDAAARRDEEVLRHWAVEAVGGSGGRVVPPRRRPTSTRRNTRSTSASR